MSVTCHSSWNGTETALDSRMSHGHTSSSGGLGGSGGGGGLGGSGGEGLSSQELRSKVTRGTTSADWLQILFNRILSHGEREVIRVKVGGDWVRVGDRVRLWEGECWSSDSHTLLARETDVQPVHCEERRVRGQ